MPEALRNHLEAIFFWEPFWCIAVRAAGIDLKQQDDT
jgi:uncharacterized membrane protein